MSDARKQAWVDLVDAADAYRVAPDKAAAAQALRAAAKAWAAVSPGAAPVVRARPKKREVEAPSPEGLERFRVVATALGKDPDALIAAFAEGWLGALRERLEEADA